MAMMTLAHRMQVFGVVIMLVSRRNGQVAVGRCGTSENHGQPFYRMPMPYLSAA